MLSPALANFVGTSSETVLDWLDQADRLDGRALSTWTSYVGGAVVRFACTDRAMAERLARRFIALTDDETPAMRIALVETEVLGWPAPGWLNEAQSIDCRRALESEGVTAIVPTDGSLPWLVFDSARGIGLIVVRRSADLSAWLIDSPFSLPLHLAFAGGNRRFVHAASLARDGHGALIVGAGGAGKSATTIAGLLSGLTTVGDDYLVLSDHGGVRASAVYRSLKQSPAGLSRFPELRGRLAGVPLNWHGKVEFDTEVVRRGCLAPDMDIAAILIPEQGPHTATTIVPSSPTAAFSALAHSTLQQLPGEGLAGFAFLTRLTRKVPSYHVRLSPDPDEVGRAIGTFLSRSGCPQGAA